MVELSTIALGFGSAVLASLIGAFSGGGSSLILLPLLLLIAPGSYASLLATTKASSTTMTIVSAKIHHGKNHTHEHLLWIIALFGLIGTGFGTYLVQFQLSEYVLKIIISSTLLGTALYLLFTKDLGRVCSYGKYHSKKLLIGTALFSLVLNVLNGLFGGTGIFLTFYLVVFLHLSFTCAIAYTMMTYLIINMFQTSYLLITEPVDLLLTGSVIIGALIGGWAGTHLQYLKGNTWVKRAAIAMMVIIGFRMLWSLY